MPILVTYYQLREQHCVVYSCLNTLMSYDTGCACETCHNVIERAKWKAFWETIGGFKPGYYDTNPFESLEQEQAALDHAYEAARRMELFVWGVLLAGGGL